MSFDSRPLSPAFPSNDTRSGTPPLVRLKALCGPGDDGTPVVTIMMPEED